MRYKNKILLLLAVIISLTLIEYGLPRHPLLLLHYEKYVFIPYQSLRNVLFGYVPFSIGDFIYVIIAVVLILLVIKWIYYLVRIRLFTGNLISSFLHTLIAAGVFYILFIVGWGANYHRTPLAKYWHLVPAGNSKDTGMVAFDKYLIQKLNDYAPHYHALPFRDIAHHSSEYYHLYVDTNKPMALSAKRSLFGNKMENFHIQGYYNPFTGEAQVNALLPAFMLPFVVCHELAHQCGIAAEGDANLMSYAVGITSSDSLFRYSCYFNIWLYAQSIVRDRDSVLAKQLKLQLNSITLAHIDTLRAIRMKHYSKWGKYSGRLYDQYLRMQHQKGGIMSYDEVAITAWEWEKDRIANGIRKIPVP
ncbi:MAG: DUF3810 domain-containing protein [Taibaiella sp.]|nr:DUF3810 domain-containing protein [Taibaiella sp.]